MVLKRPEGTPVKKDGKWYTYIELKDGYMNPKVGCHVTVITKNKGRFRKQLLRQVEVGEGYEIWLAL